MDAPGTIVAGKYELRTSFHGGMAVVWKAMMRDAAGRARAVAVKRIQRARHADPHFVRMFEEEARVGADLHHPNLVEVLDFGLDAEGGYYLVMEWVEGLDMFQWNRAFPSRRQPPPWSLVGSVGVELCRGLAAAHGRRGVRGVPAPVIHRDVSPSNVLLGVSGSVKLTDFGLARALDRSSMTRPNVIKGKLAYCAPELTNGAPPGVRSDLFSLGVVLWESLAQRRLFTGRNDLELLLAVRKGDVPRLEALRPDVPRALVEAIHQALAPDPGTRFVDALAMAQGLAQGLRTAPAGSRAALGASVRAARVRLAAPTLDGKQGGDPPRARASAIPPSIPLSVSDLEAVEGRTPPARSRLPRAFLSSAATPLPLVSRKGVR